MTSGNKQSSAMPPGQPIFGIRAGADAALLPEAEALQNFLDSPKTAGRMELHREELAWYAGMVKEIGEFEAGRRQGVSSGGFLENLYYGILGRSRFFSPALTTAVAQFKYCRHLLSGIDLKKPAAFIKSAEEEISRLKPGRKDDAAKIARLRSLIDERRKLFDAQKAQWPALRAELNRIAVSVRDNVRAVQALAEASIGTLVDLQVGKKAEHQLIEDVKTHFKGEIRDYLQQGPVTKEYIDSTKEIVARLSKQISHQMLEDIYSMTALYEAIHDHVRSSADRIDPLIRQASTGSSPSLEQDREIFSRIEQELIALISAFPLDLKPPHEAGTDEQHGPILREKRRDMLDRLFNLLPSR